MLLRIADMNIGRDKWTIAAVGVRGPVRTGTIARGYSLRNGVASRAAADRNCQRCRANRFVATKTHRRSDESLRDPGDCPSWKQTDTAPLCVPPSGVDPGQYIRQEPCTLRHDALLTSLNAR